MNKKSLTIAALIFGLILIIAVALAVWHGASRPAPTTAPAGGTATSSAATATGTPATASATGIRRTPTATGTPTPSAPANLISFTSPAAGTQWIFQNQHIIAWSRPAGSPGSLVLLGPTTNSVIGWIEQNIDLTQSSFPWNTQSVFLSQTSPLKKNILPGNYRVAITFASPNLPVVISPVFSIIPAAAAVTPTASILIQNSLFSPSSVTVTKGTRLIFVNHDAASYALTVTASGEITVAPSSTQTFDTSVFVPGNNYYFYSAKYPSMRLTVTVNSSTY